jgi:hypothetical protein
MNSFVVKLYNDFEGNVAYWHRCVECCFPILDKDAEASNKVIPTFSSYEEAYKNGWRAFKQRDGKLLYVCADCFKKYYSPKDSEQGDKR